MTANLVYMNSACRITRPRTLPFPGKVLVQKGQQVTTNEVIASIEMPEKHIDLDIATELKLEPYRAMKLIQVKNGDRVRKGDVLASRSGLMSKTIFSPEDGHVIDCSDGRILIAAGSKPQVVRAGFSGHVKEVLPERGAVLTTEGAILQGIWGNGQMAEGLLFCMASHRGDELRPDRLEVSLRGSVIFGGPCLQADTLLKAAEVPLRGLVVSGLAPDLLPLANRMPFPVMAMIGLGQAEYDEHAFEIIQKVNKRVVCINAVARDEQPGRRPEAIIPHHEGEPTSDLPDAIDYQPGQLVRFLQSPYLWETARIKSLHPDSRVFPSGICAPAALCVLDDGKEAVQPLMNLEVIL